MRRGQHTTGDSSFGRSAGMSVGRGAILILVAFFVGLFLLQKTDRAPRTVRTQTGATVPTSIPNLTLPTTVTTQGGHLPKDVKVLVANGTNTPGAASRVVPPLTTAGYNVLAPTDATKAAKAATRSSVVYYVPGYDLDARIIATRLTLQPAAVQPLPATQPVANTQGANVIIVVGPDLAGSGSTTATTARTTATTARTTAPTARTTATTVHTTTTKPATTTSKP